ncbi:MAG: pyridoxal-5'-phosphate-dependent protein subunit beta [Myxococcales bacterium]|nr:pyridoxal-5'-phosphate-dependent protein subunit beta [Myxococcales bacterium]
MIVDNVTQVVGNTPLVRLNKVGNHLKANIYGKLEYLNPGGSVKDRVAFQIIEDAEKDGLLKPGGTIVEATSGNTGMGLALAAAVKGYKCVFVMPDKMSQEKIKALRAFGAKVVITPTEVEPEDPRSYYCVSRRIANETPGAFYANQYHNQSNPKAHYLTTGPEIWEQTEGKIDVFVSSAGTGGTISGTGRYLKEQNPDLQVVGVDPVGSIYYDYFHTGKITQAYGYKVEGFGEDFLPTTMHFDVVDDVVRVTDKECFDYTRRLVREEGLYCGGSSGGAVAGAIKYAEKLDKPLNIVVILCDSATRYLSKIFDDEWMREHGFLRSAFGQETIADLLAHKSSDKLYTATNGMSVREVVGVMKSTGVSQLPVLSGERVVGIINETDVLNHMLNEDADADASIDPLVETSFAIVEPSNRVHLLGQFFTQGKVVIVVDQGRLAGIVTKIDYIDFMSRII